MRLLLAAEEGAAGTALTFGGDRLAVDLRGVAMIAGADWCVAGGVRTRAIAAATEAPMHVAIARLHGPHVHGRRIVVLVHDQALFVVDHLVADAPVEPAWDWRIGNGDGALALKVLRDRIVARRGGAGLKLFHLGGCAAALVDGTWRQPGRPEAGLDGAVATIRWTAPAATERWAVHVCALDDDVAIARWHLQERPGADAVLEAPNARERWALRIDRAVGVLHLVEQIAGRAWRVAIDADPAIESLPPGATP